jgi:histone H3/H4
MENGSYKILEATVQRTLHAHHFARSSSYASIVFTDLLSRYLGLLANTCTKHAAHAGRLSLAPSDVLNALEECGVNVEDLADYCATEAREMSRYAGHTARRVEDLNEFRSMEI